MKGNMTTKEAMEIAEAAWLGDWLVVEYDEDTNPGVNNARMRHFKKESAAKRYAEKVARIWCSKNAANHPNEIGVRVMVSRIIYEAAGKSPNARASCTSSS
jgi:hypothetical protein